MDAKQLPRAPPSTQVRIFICHDLPIHGGKHMTESQIRAALRRAKFKMVRGRKPIASRNVSAEELEAADEVRRLIPQAIVRWPKGLQNRPVIWPLGATDEETAAVMREFGKLRKH